MRSSQWRGLDTSGDSDSFVAYLDRAAVTLREAREEVIQSLELNPGCSLLDVGSGAGEFVIEVAGSVEGVRAVGIDRSDAMVAAATARAREAGVAVEFVVGDAQHLDFPDGSFDRVNCSRVLLHLEDARAAVGEMARVLAPDGRLAIIEPDHDAFMIDSEDRAIAGAVRRHLTAGLRNPDVGRRLRRLLLDAGLEVMSISGRARPLPNLQYANSQFHLFDHLEAAVAANEVDAQEAAAWRRWVEGADASKDLFIAPILFHVVATKSV